MSTEPSQGPQEEELEVAEPEQYTHGEPNGAIAIRVQEWTADPTILTDHLGRRWLLPRAVVDSQGSRVASIYMPVKLIFDENGGVRSATLIRPPYLFDQELIDQLKAEGG